MDISNKPLEERVEYALKLLVDYPLIDGDHHKQWVLDQVARVLANSPTVAATAVDAHGETYVYPTLGESDRYRAFVAEVVGEGGEWSTGIAP